MNSRLFAVIFSVFLTLPVWAGKPTFHLSYPRPNSAIYVSEVELLGMTSDVAILTVNGKPIPIAKTGAFSYLFPLSTSRNQLVFDYTSNTGQHGQFSEWVSIAPTESTATETPSASVQNLVLISSSIGRTVSTAPASVMSTPNVTATKNNTEPEIVVSTPPTHYTSSHPLVLIKGHVYRADTLSFNDTPIEFNPNSGEFSHPMVLSKNQLSTYILKATSESGAATLSGDVLYAASVTPASTVAVAVKPIEISKPALPTPSTPVVAAKALATPNIALLTPPDNFISARALVLFKGSAQKAKSVFINGQAVTLNEGRFYYKAELTSPNAYQSFVVKAVSKDGVSSELNRRVYFKYTVPVMTTPTPSPSPTPPVAVAARAPIAPSIILLSPANNLIVYKNQVLFKGSVSSAKSLKINQNPVPIDANNRFFYKAELPVVNSYQTFAVVATSADGISTTINVRVYYSAPKPLAKTLSDIAPIAPIFLSVSPKNPAATTEPMILIKGQVQNASSLEIDEMAVPLLDEGYFQFPYSFRSDGESKTVLLKAINQNSVGASVATESLTLVYQLKKEPIVPRFAALSPASDITTNQEEMLIQGKVVQATRLTINNTPVPIEVDGSFRYILKGLSSASVTQLIVTAESRDRSQKTISKIIRYHIDPVIPELTLFSPEPNFFSYKNSALVKGIVANAQTVLINGRAVSVNENGRFYEKIVLTAPNTLIPVRVQAISKTGHKTEVARNVFFAIAELPDITQLSPTPGVVIRSSANTFRISGEVKLAKSVHINNKIIPIQNGGFSVDVPLTASTQANEFKVVATSKDGLTQSKLIRIAYEPVMPKLLNVSPNGVIVSSTPTLTITGVAKNTVLLRIDGAEAPVASTGEFAFPVYLKKPSEQTKIKLFAKSKDNQVESLIILATYVPPAPPAPPAPAAPPKKSTPNVVAKPVPSTSNASKKVESNLLPTITISSPENNTVISETEVTLKGQVQNAAEFYINDRKIVLKKGGYFSETFVLSEAGQHDFNCHAIGQDHLSMVKLRKVIVRASNESTQKQADSDELAVKLKKTISLDLQDADIKEVLKILAKKGELNIVADQSLTGTVTISLKNVSIQAAIDLILNSHGLSYQIVENTLLVGEASKLNKPTHLSSKVIKLNNIKVKDLKPVLSEYLVQGESIQAVEQDNLLLVYADAKRLTAIESLAMRVDAQKIPQILLEARIIEAASSELKSLGIAWPQSTGFGIQSQDTNGVVSVQKAYTLSAVLNTMQNDGKAKILARPSIKVVNEEPAEIFIGDRLPYTEAVIDQTGRMTQSVKFLDLGITLRVKPQINPKTREIILKIEPEVSYIFAFRGQNNDVPWLKSRKVNTTVSAKDGETVVIGGLFNSADTSSISKVPFIGNAPLLGNLFKSNKSDKAATELIITVTPQIVE